MTIPGKSLDRVLGYVVPAIKSYLSLPVSNRKGPFILGLTGLQGSGKSTWASSLVNRLKEDFKFKVITVSLDDFYKDHAHLVAARECDPTNKLLRTRGQPGTHDTELARQFFQTLRSSEEDHIAIPAFDKSQHNGEGDRVPSEKWETISTQPPIEVLVFEGWCVGFSPISDQALEEKWLRAKEQSSDAAPDEEKYSTQTLQVHSLAHLKAINENLASYSQSFMGPDHFHYLIHLDTDKLTNVYHWRIDQEAALRKARGTGMTDVEVVQFVQGYMPSYELYLDGLRKTPFVSVRDWNEGRSNNLRVTLDESREIKSIQET